MTFTDCFYIVLAVSVEKKMKIEKMLKKCVGKGFKTQIWIDVEFSMKYHRTCASFIIYDISEYILRYFVFGHFYVLTVMIYWKLFYGCREKI